MQEIIPIIEALPAISAFFYRCRLWFAQKFGAKKSSCGDCDNHPHITHETPVLTQEEIDARREEILKVDFT